MGSSAGGAWLPNDPSPTLVGTTVIANSADITATGATGTTASSAPSVTPTFITLTGASGAGLRLGTGTPGQWYVVKNMGTGALNLYANGATINGTTGTTAYPITATGNLTALAFCTVAGAWQVGLNT